MPLLKKGQYNHLGPHTTKYNNTTVIHILSNLLLSACKTVFKNFSLKSDCFQTKMYRAETLRMPVTEPREVNLQNFY